MKKLSRNEMKTVLGGKTSRNCSYVCKAKDGSTTSGSGTTCNHCGTDLIISCICN